MLKQLFLPLLLLCSFFSFAQKVSLKGTLIDDNDKKPVHSATVRLTAQKDTLVNYNLVTDTKGVFEFRELDPGVYTLFISSIGYDSIRQVILLNASRTLGSSLFLKVHRC